MVGGGQQDPLRSQGLQEAADLQHARVRFSTEFINGGHDWYVWRILLHVFLTRVAFKRVGN
jgi:enterochelin esterase-like enzyme